MLNNLEKHFDTIRNQPTKPMPTGTRRQIGEELLRRCRERDARLERTAIEAEREGDADGCWIAMAARAENQRVIDKITKDLAPESAT